jgi:hypothetical protein
VYLLTSFNGRRRAGVGQISQFHARITDLLASFQYYIPLLCADFECNDDIVLAKKDKALLNLLDDKQACSMPVAGL